MGLPTKCFFVLDALNEYQITTQRQLSEKAGISLGHVNYVIKVLLKKGLIKIDSFYQSSNKKNYIYLLTPKGLETKSRLAARFVVSKLKEYSQFKRKIKEKLALIESKGHVNIVLVGPEIVKDFVDKMIKEHALNMVMVGYCKELEDLKAYGTEQFDVALIMDGNNINREATVEDFKPFHDKLLPLW